MDSPTWHYYHTIIESI